MGREHDVCGGGADDRGGVGRGLGRHAMQPLPRAKGAAPGEARRGESLLARVISAVNQEWVQLV